MSSRYLEDARRDGHDTEMHEHVLEFFDDDVKHFRVIYGTTQKKSYAGRRIRYVIVQDEGAVYETDLGKEGDTRPGWWCLHDGRRKFFLSERILDITLAAPGTFYTSGCTWRVHTLAQVCPLGGHSQETCALRRLTRSTRVRCR